MASTVGGRGIKDNAVLHIDFGNRSKNPLSLFEKGNYGTSAYYCVVGSSGAVFSLPYPNTIVKQYDNGVITDKVSSSTEPRTVQGQSINLGNLYFSNKPMRLYVPGYANRVMPTNLAGTHFGGFSNRYNNSTYYIYTPFQSASVEVFDNVVNGVGGTPTSVISVDAYSTETYSTPSESTWVFFRSDVPVNMSVEEDAPGDYISLTPASQIRYRRGNQFESTVSGSVPAVSNNYVVSDDDLCVDVAIADGDGGDAIQGVGLEYLSDTFTIGTSLSDYQIIAPYPNTTVDVKYYSGGQWNLLERHQLSGSIYDPDKNFRQGALGPGVETTLIDASDTNFAGGADLWIFESTKPIALFYNDPSEDEESVFGWKKDNIFTDYVKNLTNKNQQFPKINIPNFGDDYIEFSDNSFVLIPEITKYQSAGSINRCVDLWVQDLDGGDNVFCGGQATSGQRLYIGQSNNYWSFGWGSKHWNLSPDIGSKASATTDVTNLTLNVSAGTASLYVNGEYTFSFIDDTVNITGMFPIGSYIDTSNIIGEPAGNTGAHKMFNFKLYDRSLSAVEIQRNYRSQRRRYT